MAQNFQAIECAYREIVHLRIGTVAEAHQRTGYTIIGADDTDCHCASGYFAGVEVHRPADFDVVHDSDSQSVVGSPCLRRRAYRVRQFETESASATGLGPDGGPQE